MADKMILIISCLIGKRQPLYYRFTGKKALQPVLLVIVADLQEEEVLPPCLQINKSS